MYLNRQNKERSLTSAVFAQWLKDLADEWEEHGQDSDVTGNLRRGASFIEKGIDNLFQQLDDEEVATIVDKFDQYEIACQYSDRAKREYEKKKQMESVVPVDQEDLFDMLEYPAQKCLECNAGKKGARQCELKSLFLKYEVPKLNPSSDICPYQS